jgi:hypothetical protein
MFEGVISVDRKTNHQDLTGQSGRQPFVSWVSYFLIESQFTPRIVSKNAHTCRDQLLQIPFGMH